MKNDAILPPTLSSDRTDLVYCPVEGYIMGIFNGKVALVTGANVGIGLAAARDFASKGASVVIAARRETEGTAAAEQIVSEGGNAIFIKTDVTDEAQVKNMVDQTISTYGRLDYAFNNAGILGDLSAFVDGTAENFTNVMDINVTGVFLCMKHEIQAMLKTGGGAIVNCSSIAGQTGGSVRTQRSTPKIPNIRCHRSSKSRLREYEWRLISSWIGRQTDPVL